MNKKLIEYLKEYKSLLEDKLFFLNCKDMWSNEDYNTSHKLDEKISDVKKMIEEYEENE